MSKTYEIPYNQRLCISIEEAAEYSMIGENRLRQIIDIDKCEKRLDWILRVGQWTRIKREPFEKWVLSQSDL
jgi:hypothetical protein